MENSVSTYRNYSPNNFSFSSYHNDDGSCNIQWMNIEDLAELEHQEEQLEEKQAWGIYLFYSRPSITMNYVQVYIIIFYIRWLINEHAISTFV